MKVIAFTFALCAIFTLGVICWSLVHRNDDELDGRDGE